MDLLAATRVPASATISSAASRASTTSAGNAASSASILSRLRRRASNSTPAAQTRRPFNSITVLINATRSPRSASTVSACNCRATANFPAAMEKKKKKKKKKKKSRRRDSYSHMVRAIPPCLVPYWCHRPGTPLAARLLSAPISRTQPP